VTQAKNVWCNAGECKITKIKNKHQMMMTKGNRSASRQQAQGMICQSVMWQAATKVSGLRCGRARWWDPEINRQGMNGQCRQGNEWAV